MISVLFYYARFGGIEFLLYFFILLGLFFLMRVAMLGADHFLFKDRRASRDALLLGKVFFIICAFSLIYFCVLGFFIQKLDTRPSPLELARNDQLLMNADRVIFGAYVPYWFGNKANPLQGVFSFLSSALIYAYNSLTLVLGFVFLLALFKNGGLFYKMALAFALTTFLSLPFWYALPALTPLNGYTDNILRAPIPAPIKRYVSSYQYSAPLAAYLAWPRSFQKDYGKQFFDATTIPSMHVAWATVALYFGIQALPVLGLVLIPYFILNFIGAIYTLQHYAVDTIAGMLVAVAGIILAIFLSRRWTPRLLLDFSAFIKRDIERAKNGLSLF